MNTIRRDLIAPVVRIAIVGAMAAFAIGTLQGAWANPSPMGGVFFHVHPVDPQFCDQCPISYCEQIVQHTTATGTLEFDLFVTHHYFYPGTPIYALDCEIFWGLSLSLLEYEVCGGGVGQLTIVEPRQAQLNITWPECPVVENQLWLAARFVFEASGHGAVAASWGSASVTLGCPPNTQVETDLASVPGYAGVECSFCDTPCTFDEPCEAGFWPLTYSVYLEPGEATEITLQGYAGGHYGLVECSATIVATENWVRPLEEWIFWLGNQPFEIPVRINAQGLDPGSYSAWVRTDSECVSCARIDLTVIEPQGVAEGDETPPAPPGQEVKTSWGRLKELYR